MTSQKWKVITSLDVCLQDGCHCSEPQKKMLKCWPAIRPYFQRTRIMSFDTVWDLKEEKNPESEVGLKKISKSLVTLIFMNLSLKSQGAPGRTETN